MNMIDVKALAKTWPGPVAALCGIDITVGEGELFGLLGPNGAGKSTTMRILATLSAPDTGTAMVAGYDSVRDPASVRKSIGYVAQASTADQLLTGAENLLLQGRLYGLRDKDLGHRVSDLLALFDLKDAAHRPVRGWSGGMRRRLDLAMGIIHRPRLLLLDEPSAGLDPESRSVVWRELQRLRSQDGMTVLFTTHYLEEADRFADRVAIIDKGRIVAEGTPAALKGALEGDRISLSFADGEAAQQALARIAALTPVLSAQAIESRVEARVADGARAMPQIIGALAADMILEVSMARPSLDDLYLSVTGKSFEQASEGKS